MKLLRTSYGRSAYAASISRGDTAGSRQHFMSHSGPGGYTRKTAISEGIYLNGLEYFTDNRNFQTKVLSDPGKGVNSRYLNYPEIHRPWQMSYATQNHKKYDNYLLNLDGVELTTAGMLIAQTLYGYHRHDYTYRRLRMHNVVVVNCSRIVMTGNEWEETPYFRTYNTIALSRALMSRAKQLYQSEPRKLLWGHIMNSVPREVADHHAAIGRHLHLFNGEEHPFEHWHPVDVTNRVLLSTSEDLDPDVFHGGMKKMQALTFVTKQTKRVMAVYGGGGAAIDESAAPSAFHAQGSSLED